MKNISWATARKQALTLCKGSYQKAIVYGGENLSGAGLKGKASKYSARYAASRGNLLFRILKAGIPCVETQEEHGKRVLVWGTWAVAHAQRIQHIREGIKQVIQDAHKDILREVPGEEKEVEWFLLAKFKKLCGSHFHQLEVVSKRVRRAAQSGKGYKEANHSVDRAIREFGIDAVEFLEGVIDSHV